LVSVEVQEGNLRPSVSVEVQEGKEEEEWGFIVFLPRLVINRFLFLDN